MTIKIYQFLGIALDVGVKKMNLISYSKKSVVGLEGYGLEIAGYEKPLRVID